MSWDGTRRHIPRNSKEAVVVILNWVIVAWAFGEGKTARETKEYRGRNNTSNFFMGTKMKNVVIAAQ